MRLKQYLTEEVKFTDVQIDKWTSMIKKDCRPFINESRYLMYRGIKKEFDEITKLKVRQDRKPSSTPEFKHKIFDNAFNKNFGVKARSQTVFCTGRMNQATYYGDVYCVFPIGKFDYIWSDTIGDMYDSIIGNLSPDNLYLHRDMGTNISKIIKIWVKKNKETINWDDRKQILKIYVYVVDELIKQKYTKNSNLRYAIASGNEIMVHCKEYYVIPFDEMRMSRFDRDKLISGFNERGIDIKPTLRR